MKIFTRILLAISGILLCVSAVFLLIAGSKGLTWQSFTQMVADGKFSFDINDMLVIHLNFDDNEYSGLETIEITKECTALDIELGAGTLKIIYDDVEHITIEQKNIPNLDVDLDSKELQIESNLNFNIGTSNASLIITIPKDMTFDEVSLEIGASVATITDLSADTIDVEIGAGQATISNMIADNLSLSVGAGEAILEKLDAKKLKAEVGIGSIDATLIGSEDDYNQTVNCAIGSVDIGDDSYQGLGSAQTVTPDDATRSIDVDCGIGEVNISFLK